MTILSRFLSSFFILLLAAGACDAALVRTDGPARIANPSGALIDSDETDGDPATNRHLVQMAIACSFTTSGVSNNSGSYRVLFELRDESGVPQPMDDGAGNPLTSITTDAQTVSLLLGNSASLSFAVDAAPAAALDLTKRYRVQATVQRLVSAVWTTQVVCQGEVGFLVGLPTTVSPDVAYNIHGRVESAALASPVMVRNADGTGGFVVSG